MTDKRCLKRARKELVWTARGSILVVSGILSRSGDGNKKGFGDKADKLSPKLKWILSLANRTTLFQIIYEGLEVGICLTRSRLDVAVES